MLLRLWVILILLLGSLALSLSNVALAEDNSSADSGVGKSSDEKKKEEDKNKNPHPGNPSGSGDRNSDNHSEKGSGATGSPDQGNQGSRNYYGQITLSASGRVLTGEAQIQSDSPWLRLAVPGMWIEANGSWNGNVFIATEVKLQFPRSWAYYQGPAELVGAKDYMSVSAWLSSDQKTPFIALKNAPDTQNQVWLVAYFDGTRLRAVPSSFSPPPAGLKTGWVELTGTLTPQGLVWNSAKAFP